MEVELLRSLDGDVFIWRYMSLDKFINLVADARLHFTPLWKYMRSDPYEGYPPAVALEAMYEIGRGRYADIESKLDSLATTYPGATPEAHENLADIKRQIAEQPLQFRRTTQALFKGQLVSCWHANDAESEAMWKLYSDSGKGVAIKTRVRSLAQAIESGGGHSSARKIFIGKVRYIDYSDSSLTPPQCVVDGHLSPLLKRLSFKHEEEVRAFFLPECKVGEVETFKPDPVSLPVDIEALVEGIYISPYADASFANAVRTVAGKFGMTGKLKQSSILMGADNLFAGILNG